MQNLFAFFKSAEVIVNSPLINTTNILWHECCKAIFPFSSVSTRFEFLNDNLFASVLSRHSTCFSTKSGLLIMVIITQLAIYAFSALMDVLGEGFIIQLKSFHLGQYIQKPFFLFLCRKTYIMYLVV